MSARGDDHNPGQARRDFDRLYELWSEPVYRYLARLVGPGATAEDLFQETWMRAIEHREQLRDGERFGPWVMRIARNQAFNHSRLRRRKTQVWILSNLAGRDDEEHGEDLIARASDGAADPRDSAIEAERRRLVSDLLAGLDGPTQEMLQLRYFEHMKLAEVAEILGVPLGTVCTKVHRALRTIRAELERRGLPDMKAV